MMKSILTTIVFLALAVAGLAQTRNVIVNTNGVVQSPTNFWSADASNVRTGLGLGTAATNPASAFQPSSLVLSNLSSSNGSELTNLTAANITGAIAISNGGSGATTAGEARTNLGIGWPALTNSNAANALLGYTTNNGSVVMPSSLTFSNNVTFLQGMSAETNAVNAGGTLFAGNGSTISFYATEDQSRWRTNLGLGWSALTNTNTSGFNASIYGSGTNPVLYDTNGEVVSPTNFWQVAPIVTRFVEFDPATNATTNIVAARNLHIHSLAISRTGVTSTIALPTTNSFDGDIALVVHQGPTSSVTAVRTAGAATNLVTLNQPEEAVEFVYYNDVWQFNHNQSFVEPIYFSGTNATANAAASRTNLSLGWIDVASLTNAITLKTNLTVGGYGLGPYIGHSVKIFGNVEILAYEPSLDAGEVAPSLSVGPVEISGFTGTPSPKSVVINVDGISFSNNASGFTRTNLGLSLPALTNTDVTNFRTAIELGATNNVTFNDVVASGTLTATSTVTAKTNLVVEGFVDYTAARTNNTPTNTPNFAAHAAWIEVKIGTNSFFLPAYQ